MENRDIIKEAIEQKMKEAGISGRKLAREIGIDYQVFHRSMNSEKGNTMIASKILNYFNVKLVNIIE